MLGIFFGGCVCVSKLYIDGFFSLIRFYVMTFHLDWSCSKASVAKLHGVVIK